MIYSVQSSDVTILAHITEVNGITYGHIENFIMEIPPHQKRKGIGSKYYRDLEKWFNSFGVTQIRLQVFYRSDAVHFWTYHGFKVDTDCLHDSDENYINYYKELQYEATY